MKSNAGYIVLKPLGTILVFIYFLMSSGSLFGQNKESKKENHNVYNTAIGLRAGSTPGFTFKTFIKGNAAFEGIIHTRYHGILFTGLYEIHKQAFDTKNLHWFYGPGAHVGIYRANYYRDRFGRIRSNDAVTAGIDGILGLEYYIGEIPFTVGVDIKPFVDIVNPGFGYWDGALTIRYTFK